MSDEDPIIYEKLSNTVLAEYTNFKAKIHWGNVALCRLFDFNLRQITSVVDSEHTNNIMPGDTRNFRDIEGKEGLKQAWHKLRELGGNPPELNLDEKKPVSISSKNNQSQKI